VHGQLSGIGITRPSTVGVNTIENNSILHVSNTVEYRHVNLAIGATLNVLGTLLVGLYFGPGLERMIVAGIGLGLINGSVYFLRDYRVKLKSLKGLPMRARIANMWAVDERA
jgi:hypothetical protein